MPRPIGFTPDPHPVPIWPMSAVVARRPVPDDPMMRDVLAFLGDFRAERGYGPTFREIAGNVMPWRHWTATRDLIYEMIALGYLESDPHVARSLREARLPTISHRGGIDRD